MAHPRWSRTGLVLCAAYGAAAGRVAAGASGSAEEVMGWWSQGAGRLSTPAMDGQCSVRVRRRQLETLLDPSEAPLQFADDHATADHEGVVIDNGTYSLSICLL